MITNFVVYLSDVLCPGKRPIVIRLLKNDNLLVRSNSFLSSHISSTCTTSRWFLVPSWLLLGQEESQPCSEHSACVV